MKRRINLIIGKKQIILAGLTLILGVAIYINFIVTSGVTRDEPAIGDTDDEAVANYGDEVFVANTGDSTGEGANSTEAEPVQAEVTEKEAAKTADVSADAADDDTASFFAQARLDRQESREEALDVIKSLYQGGDATDTEIAVIAQDASNISGYIESESKIENLLRAQGFEEVLCYLSEDGANVIVKTQGLDAAQAAKIKSALLSEVKIPAANITIVEIK